MSGAPDGGMRHSVVVPTFQRRALVTKVVQSLARQNAAPLEVIVVVDGSTDGTEQALAEICTPFPLKVLEQPNAGAAHARNRGARAARGDLLLFLDDDMIADPDLLIELRRMHTQGADAVLGHIPVASGFTAEFLSRGLVEWAERRRERLVRDGRVSASDVLTGQLSVRRDVFEALKGFDERFTRNGSFGGEDTDFGRRLLAQGYRVEFAPRAVSYQHYAVTPRAYLRQWYQAGAADVAYLRKHPADFEQVRASRRPNAGVNRFLVRPMANVPLLRDLAAATARPLAVTLASRWPDGAWTSRFFFKTRNLEYWRGTAKAGGMPRARPFRVLCYHALSDLAGTPIAEYGIPAAVLRRQLRLLQTFGFRLLEPDEALRSLRGERGVPRGGVLVTFDDCYADLVDAGLPVLEDLAAPAIAFAVADLVGRTNRWDRTLGAPELPLIDASGLRDLQRSGIEIGAHGSSHEPLTQVSDRPSSLTHETRTSTATLRELGLGPVRTFAYPYGEHDAPSRAAVAAAGLEAAFTVTPGLARPGSDPYQVPRIEILRSDRSSVRFIAKVFAAGRIPRTDTKRVRWVTARTLRRLGQRVRR